MNAKLSHIGTGIVMMALTAFSAGLLVPQTAEAWDPNPYRTQLGVTQLQRQVDLQNQMIRQLDRQRAIQNLREQDMSRQLHRQVQTLRDRQADMTLRQELRGGRYGALIGGPAGPQRTTASAKADADKRDPKATAIDAKAGFGSEGKAEVKTDSPANPVRAQP